MATGSSVIQAQDLVNKRLKEDPSASKSSLISEASMQFGLSPVEVERLIALLKDAGKNNGN